MGVGFRLSGRTLELTGPWSPTAGRAVRLLRPSEPRHGPVAQLLIAWAPLSLILLAYAAAGWISAPLGTADGADSNRLGFGVHVSGPADADRAVFGVDRGVTVRGLDVERIRQ